MKHACGRCSAPARRRALRGAVAAGADAARAAAARAGEPRSTSRSSRRSSRSSRRRSPRRSCRARSCSSAAATASSTRRRSATARSCPTPEPMTLDTIFDVASLTKVVATTTSVMMLVEEGKHPADRSRVASTCPGSSATARADITIRHLMTHMSGLRPDVDLGEAWSGSDTAIALAIEEVPAAAARRALRLQRHQLLPARRHRPPRQRQPLDRFAQTRIFEPLGMKDTMFLPPAALAAADRADRELHAARLAVRGARTCRCCAASCTIRRRAGWAASPGTPACSARRRTSPIFCRMLLDGGAVPRRADPVAAGGREDDDAGDAAGRAERPRPRLGHRLDVLGQPRRAAAARLVRPHRVHRHVAVDRSGDAACSSSSCRTACIPTARGT